MDVLKCDHRNYPRTFGVARSDSKSLVDLIVRRFFPAETQHISVIYGRGRWMFLQSMFSRFKTYLAMGNR
ncbi:hypothetical protein L596_015525 [Steinernema carpocapsae]|uniref:Uncharacterized protein n=1 Tax=Steinernema carpocapsae TaxID=34508 RepID=A0A4U5NFV8_STECR|nr:hypothetical protein L596_015525 [Steinernema carpocapsae]